MQRDNAGNDRVQVPQPVLGVEHAADIAFAHDGLGNDRRTQIAPGGENRFARAQPAGEVEGRHVSRSS